MLKKGDKAPDFCLEGVDENGKEGKYRIKDFRGKKVVLYFYPKDNTPGCTQESCDFRDNMAKLHRNGVVILGVSPDNLNSHKRFHEKHGLNFPLLSDPYKRIAGLYGAYGEKKMYGKITKGIIRSTFIIDEDEKIAKAWYKVKVKGHVDEVCSAL